MRLALALCGLLAPAPLLGDGKAPAPVPLKEVRLEAPAWCGFAPSVAALREGEMVLGSAKLSVVLKDKALHVSLSDKTGRAASKPAYLGSALGAVGLVKAPCPQFGPEAPPSDAVAFLAGALEGKVAGKALRFLDLDGNGSALDFGKDGVLYPGTRAIVPLEPRMTIARTVVDFTVKEGTLLASETPLKGELTEEELVCLEIWNEFRVGAGVPALEPVAGLCEAARAHALYLKRNPDIWPSPTLDSHDEDPKRPGFTPEGQASARRSNLGSGGPAGFGHNDLRKNTIGWLTELYHKPNMVIPGARTCGICGRNGYDAADDGSQGGSIKDALPWRVPMAFPAPWQTTPLRTCPAEEIPNPMPVGTTEGAGASVLLFFGFGPGLPPPARVQGALRRIEGGKPREVEAFLSSPEKPANASMPDNARSICLFPRKPLDAGSEFEVEIRYEQDGKPCRASWRFFTAK